MSCPVHKLIFAALTILIMACSIGNASASPINWRDILQVGVSCSGLPGELIFAVILNESGGNPNAVNVNGYGSYSPSTPEQALRYMYRLDRANVDIGLMQVNWLTWGRVYRLSPADLLNPTTNICVGSRILKNYIAEHHMTWRGVGRYNAVSHDKQEAYAYRIARTVQIIQKIFRRAEN